MKQYTTPEQTAKLIELGFKPESIEFASDCEVVNEYGTERIECINPQFSIGELIEMLPAKVGGFYCNIDRSGQKSWAVSYDPIEHCSNRVELIDAVFDMVVELKEKGVI